MEGIQAFILSMERESHNRYQYGKTQKNINNPSSQHPSFHYTNYTSRGFAQYKINHQDVGISNIVWACGNTLAKFGEVGPEGLA